MRYYCAWSVFDCQCDRRSDLLLDAAGNQCVKPEDCSSACPANSSPYGFVMSSGECPHGFSQCRCDNGFLRDDESGTCVSSSEECPQQCPPNSAPSWSCPSDDNFKNVCRCADGFWKFRDGEEFCIEIETACVHPEWPGASGYQCPPNSSPTVPFPSCPWDFYSCKCDDGFFWDTVTATCVASEEECGMKCPPHSSLYPTSTTCPAGNTLKNECVCEEGFWKNRDGEEFCIPIETACLNPDWPGSTGFQCPPGATPKSAFPECPWSIWNCQCPDGEEPDGDTNTCVFPKCGDFTCPGDAIPKDDCVWSIWNCQCPEGEEPDGDTDTCVAQKCGDFTCPGNAIPKDDCIWSIWNCQCPDGEEPDGDTNTCVPKTTCWSDFVCPDGAVPNAESNGCPWSIWNVRTSIIDHS